DGKLEVDPGVDSVRTAVERPERTFWVDLIDPAPDVVREVAHILGLHPLIAADIERRNERPKVAVFEDNVHVVVFRLEVAMEPSEIDFVLGKRYLLSVHEAG